MDKKGIRMRKKSSDGKTDDERAKEYIKVVEDKFPEVKSKHLQYLFLDACFDEEDEDEEEAFKTAMESLWKMLDSQKDGLPTTTVNKNVESEHGKIKRELEAREKDKEIFTKQLEDVNNQLKDAEANRHKDEQKYKETVDKLNDKISGMQQQSNRRGGGFLTDLIGIVFPPAAPILKAIDNLGPIFK